MVDRARPDVIAMDVRMPRMDGPAATQQLLGRPDPPGVVVLTTSDADEYVLRALAGGASGFLLEDRSPPLIVEAIHRVAADEPVLSPGVTAQLIRRVVSAPAAGSDAGRGTRRRRSAGDPRRARAGGRRRGRTEQVRRGDRRELSMSLATVAAHVPHILVATGVSDRVRIAICVHEAGLA